MLEKKLHSKIILHNYLISAKDLYIALGNNPKNHQKYHRWLKRIVLNNVTLIENQDYIRQRDEDANPNHAGTKPILTLITPKLGIAICINSGTVKGKQIKGWIENNFVF